jgi:hypothetical protein
MVAPAAGPWAPHCISTIEKICRKTKQVHQALLLDTRPDAVASVRCSSRSGHLNPEQQRLLWIGSTRPLTLTPDIHPPMREWQENDLQLPDRRPSLDVRKGR